MLFQERASGPGHLIFMVQHQHKNRKDKNQEQRPEIKFVLFDLPFALSLVIAALNLVDVVLLPFPLLSFFELQQRVGNLCGSAIVARALSQPEKVVESLLLRVSIGTSQGLSQQFVSLSVLASLDIEIGQNSVGITVGAFFQSLLYVNRSTNRVFPLIISIADIGQQHRLIVGTEILIILQALQEISQIAIRLCQSAVSIGNIGQTIGNPHLITRLSAQVTGQAGILQCRVIVFVEQVDIADRGIDFVLQHRIVTASHGVFRLFQQRDGRHRIVAVKKLDDTFIIIRTRELVFRSLLLVVEHRVVDRIVVDGQAFAIANFCLQQGIVGHFRTVFLRNGGQRVQIEVGSIYISLHKQRVDSFELPLNGLSTSA